MLLDANSFYPQGGRVRKTILPDIISVAPRIREKDWYEIQQGSGGISDRKRAATLMYSGALIAFSVLDCENQPQAIVFSHVVIPGVWSVGFFATDHWDKVFTSASKYIKVFIDNAVKSRMVRRVEARSLTTYTEAHEWLMWLGARKECVLPDWGTDRTEFTLFAWRLSDYDNKEL
jgi:hypothetical protein